MNTSKIEWTECTWNVVTGCTPVSAGCEHCYARRMAPRLHGRFGYPDDDPFRVTLHKDRLGEPLHLRKPRRIFVCSMGDLFHEDVPDEFIDKVFAVMALCPQHRFQVLTKRAERLPDYMARDPHNIRTRAAAVFTKAPWSWPGWPLPNVWLGVTAENQETADERIPLLLQTPAAVRFVSLEPMLGPVDLDGYLEPECCTVGDPEGEPTLDWTICGGESGPGARPMRPEWAIALFRQCQSAGVPFFWKQEGRWLQTHPPSTPTAGWNETRKCRQYPKGNPK